MTQTAADRFRSRHLHEVKVRDLPDPPRSHWRIIGPGVIAAGVGLASGEFILFPYIASQVGLVFLWAAAVGLITQWFLNMEIERYTLATGETALTGFSRYLAALGPGLRDPDLLRQPLARLGDELGDDADLPLRRRAALDRDRHARGDRRDADPGAGDLHRAGAGRVPQGRRWSCSSSWSRSIFAVDHRRLVDARARRRSAPEFPTELGFALMLSALVFAGAGGGQNLVQSNWIRDKGFGMGAYVPRLVSPITGREEAAPDSAGFVFEDDRRQPGAVEAVVEAGQQGAARTPSC